MFAQSRRSHKTTAATAALLKKRAAGSGILAHDKLFLSRIMRPKSPLGDERFCAAGEEESFLAPSALLYVPHETW